MSARTINSSPALCWRWRKSTGAWICALINISSSILNLQTGISPPIVLEHRCSRIFGDVTSNVIRCPTLSVLPTGACHPQTSWKNSLWSRDTHWWLIGPQAFMLHTPSPLQNHLVLRTTMFPTWLTLTSLLGIKSDWFHCSIFNV